MKQELLKGLTEEQIAKVKNCRSEEELLKLAKKEGVELTNEQLTAISGGMCSSGSIECPKCGSTNVVTRTRIAAAGSFVDGYHCQDCGKDF